MRDKVTNGFCYMRVNITNLPPRLNGNTLCYRHQSHTYKVFYFHSGTKYSNKIAIIITVPPSMALFESCISAP